VKSFLKWYLHAVLFSYTIFALTHLSAVVSSAIHGTSVWVGPLAVVAVFDTSRVAGRMIRKAAKQRISAAKPSSAPSR